MNEKPPRTSAATGTWWKGVYHTIRSRLLSKTKHKTIIYRYDPEAGARAEALVEDRDVSDLDFRRYESMAEVPKELFETLDAHERRKVPENFRKQFANGAILYLATAGNEIASFGWSIRRSALKDWHAEIDDDAVILFAGGTRQKFRGRGLYKVMLYQRIAGERESSNKLYIDAVEYNAVSRRNMEAVGFRQIGVNERPLRT